MKTKNIFNRERNDNNWANYKKTTKFLCKPTPPNQKRVFPEFKH